MRVFVQHQLGNLIEPRVTIGTARRDARHRVVQNLVRERRERSRLEGVLECGDLEEDAAEGPDVGRVAVRLVAQLYSRRSTRAMFYRRIRSLHDLYLQPSDTPMEERYYERRLNELSALIDPEDIVPSDAQRDFEKWGSWLHNADGGSAPVVPYTTNHPDVETMAEGVQRLRAEFLAPRRAFIYSQNITAFNIALFQIKYLVEKFRNIDF